MRRIAATEFSAANFLLGTAPTIRFLSDGTGVPVRLYSPHGTGHEGSWLSARIYELFRKRASGPRGILPLLSS